MFYPTTCVRLRYGYLKDMLSGFSREYGYPHCQVVPKKNLYFKGRLKQRICLPSSTPTLVNGPFRRSAEVSLLRLHIAH